MPAILFACWGREIRYYFYLYGHTYSHYSVVIEILESRRIVSAEYVEALILNFLGE